MKLDLLYEIQPKFGLGIGPFPMASARLSKKPMMRPLRRFSWPTVSASIPRGWSNTIFATAAPLSRL